MQCLHCKTVNDPNEGFCRRCGRQLIFMPMPLLSQSTPIKRKKSYDRQILIGVILVLGLGWLTVSMILGESNPLTPAPTPVARPTPSPTPTLSDDERLSNAKALLLQGFDRDRYKNALNYLKEIPEIAKEYREAQTLVKKISRAIEPEKSAAPKTAAQQ